MPVLLTTPDFRDLLTYDEIVQTTEQAYREWAAGTAFNDPRRTLQAGLARLRMHAGGLPSMEAIGVRVHAPVNNVARSISPAFKTQVVLLWNQKNFGLEAILAGESYQLHFPAATSAVAAKFLARKDAVTLGVFGTSGLARQHIATFLVVREFKQVKVYSRNKEGRNAFAKKIEQEFSVEARPVDAPKDVVAESDVVVTATDSDVPVFDGNWVEPGTHVSTSVAENKGEAEARSLAAKPREIDDTIVMRSDLIVTNSKEQVILDEQGSIFEPMKKGLVKWDDVRELSSLVLGEIPSRRKDSDITLFLHSGGQGVADVAIAKKILEKAKTRGLGRQIVDISE